MKLTEIYQSLSHNRWLDLVPASLGLFRPAEQPRRLKPQSIACLKDWNRVVQDGTAAGTSSERMGDAAPSSISSHHQPSVLIPGSPAGKLSDEERKERLHRGMCDLLEALINDSGIRAAYGKKTKPTNAETQPESANGDVSSPAGSTSKKRGSDEPPADPPSPPKKPKLTASEVRALVKHDGVRKADQRIINPKGVTEGIIKNRFPTALKNHNSRGFANGGNDCYRNAALQALLHVPAVYHLLGTMHRHCKKQLSRCVTCAFQDVCQRYWNTALQEESFSLDHLNLAVRARIPRHPIGGGVADSLAEIHENAQLDAMNYIEFLLSELVQDSESELSESVAQVFNLVTKSGWKCVDCGTWHPTSTVDSAAFSPVQLDVSSTKEPSLVKLINETVFADSGLQPKCESTQCEAERAQASPRKRKIYPLQTKLYTIVKAPEVLILQQKRFYNVKNANGKAALDRRGQMITRKYSGEVPCEEYINLGPHTETHDDLIYRLDAVIGHRGAGTDSGHYIAAVRAHDGINYDTIDDESVTSTDEAQHLEYPGTCSRKRRGKVFDPYVLIYSKVHG